MRVDTWLNKAQTKLTQAGIGTARLDSLVLLEDVTGRDRAWLLATPEFELSSDQIDALQKLLRRRLSHEPLAYIRGKTEFYGREFIVSSAVLEPRPESETMVDLLKKLPIFTSTDKSGGGSTLQALDMSENQQKCIRIADVGTGSGALGITAALELPDACVELIEIDPAAIIIAKSNVDLHTTSISVIQSDLLHDTTQNYDVLLCNLPYVPDSHTINQAALHEPKLAIFGGPDGLEIYRKLYEQIRNIKKRPLYILCESLPPQHTSLNEISENAGYKLAKNDDFIQVFKRK